jgi:hypothetical protein
MASQFSTYTKEELLKKMKNQKIFIIIQSFVVFLLFVLAIIQTIEKGITFQTFLPLFFVPMLFVMLAEKKKIKKELALRK